MAVLEENRIGQLTPDMEEFRGMVKAVLERNIDRYRQHFQFGWTGSTDIANSVAMETLALPNLLVVNASSYQHYLPYDEPAHLTIEAIQIFLDDILEGTAPVYGGSSYSVRLYRAYYEAKSNIVEMWKGNPALASVLFGLPFGFFALICYSICCADIMDAEEDDDEEEQTLAAASRASSGSDGWHEKTD
jgi:thioredoxin domain-containing protein 10